MPQGMRRNQGLCVNTSFYQVREIKIFSENICKMEKLKVRELWSIGHWPLASKLALFEKYSDNSSLFIIHSHFSPFKLTQYIWTF